MSDRIGNRKVASRARPRATKEQLALAVERMGGVDGLVKWARRTRENERVFWTILLPRLLPLTAESEVEMGHALVAMAARWLPSQ